MVLEEEVKFTLTMFSMVIIVLFICIIDSVTINTDIYEGEVTSVKHSNYAVKIEKDGKKNVIYVSPVEYKAIRVGMYLVWDNEEEKVEELRDSKYSRDWIE